VHGNNYANTFLASSNKLPMSQYHPRDPRCAHILKAYACRSLLQPHLLVVLEQIGKAMAADPHTRSDFVQCGGLKFVQELGKW